MADSEKTAKAVMERPINCSAKILNRFIEVVMASGEVPLANLQKGVPSAEMLFFMMVDNEIVGVSAARYQNRPFHKHLFEKAGVPKMYNPHSVEICWLSILPEFRAYGGWTAMFNLRRKYLGNRPCHAITRVENVRVADLSRYGYHQVGEPFYPDTGDDLIRLMVANHDPVFDPEKRLIYGKLPKNKD